jgi:transitional endoplasmic reticulum ATPase
MRANERIRGKAAQVADIAIGGREGLEGAQMCVVSESLAAKMGLSVAGGDGVVVEISGPGGKTALRAVSFRSGSDIVGLDGAGRDNTGCEVGDRATLRGISPDALEEAPSVDIIVTSVSTDSGEEADNPAELIREMGGLIEQCLSGLTFCDGNCFSVATEGGYTANFIVRGPQLPFIIGDNTSLSLRPARQDVEVVTWNDIGGLDGEIDEVREAVELPIRYPELFNIMRLSPPRGILLTGPPGTGKTLIGKALSSVLDFHFIFVDGGSIMSRFYGESEKILRSYFEEARDKAPAVIFIDEIDAMAPPRGDGSSNVEGRVVSTLLTEMDGMKKSEKVVVIGATNRVDGIDSALRRPGRFEREISVGVPDKEGREEILAIHLKGTPFGEDVEEAIPELAGETHGFVGADLAGVVREAKFSAIRDVVPDLDERVDITESLVDSLRLRRSHLEDAAQRFDPSALRQFILEVPDVTWDEIGGLEDQVKAIQESVVIPLKKPERFEEMGVKVPSGLLLYGPPGCGKTLVAKAVATESEANFISIKGPELLSKWVGESERAIRQLFSKARQVSPCVVFIDEADTVGRSRGMYTDTKVGENMLSQLLTELDGIESRDGVVVIMASNRPDVMDPALLRPGRVDRFIYVGSPGREAREEIFGIHGGSMKIEEGVDFGRLAEATGGFSGADIEAICNEAGMRAIREGEDAVRMEHFEAAIGSANPTINGDMDKYYEEIRRKMRGVSRRRGDPNGAYI